MECLMLDELSQEELYDVDGGSVWGVLGGVASVIGGVILIKTGIGAPAGTKKIVEGSLAIVGGIAAIASS